MSNSTNQSSGGIGFLSLLTILFIGLKLGDVIDWSYFWVLSPIIIPIVLVLGVGVPLYCLFTKQQDPRLGIRVAAAAIIAIPTWLITFILYYFIG